MNVHVQRFSCTAALALCACSGASEDQNEGPRPTLAALSRDEISVGQSLEFIGEGYLAAGDGYTEIQLEGRYLTESGSDPVSLTVRPVAGSETRLLWPYFGPYDIPFSPSGDQLGVFEGTATAVNVTSSGDERASEPLPVSLRVMPSIIVRALEPVAAGCETPSTRLLGGFRYRIVIEAVGIDPDHFAVELRDEPSGELRQSFQQAADGPAATFGEAGDLVLPAVPQEAVFYSTRLRFWANDSAGRAVTSQYTIGVHRAIEYFDHGAAQAAQIYPANPVTGCLAGGAEGKAVSYDDGDADARERQVATHWSESWIEAQPGSFSPAQGNQVSLRFRQSASQGWIAEWKDGDSVVGRITMTSAAEWAVRQLFGAAAPDAWLVGHDFTAMDSESWAYDAQADEAVIGSDGFWRISSADVISSQASAEILPGMFGVWYRQPTRLARSGTIAAYDLCGTPEVIAEASFIDHTWTASLAQAAQCPPFPEPDLPPAECYIAPCSE